MTIKEQKEKCVNCHYGRKCSGWNLRFIGCFCEPFKGKWVAEIDKCPKENRMLDIWVDNITIKILNMARDGYGLDTRLHNDYVDEIKNKTKDNILHFLAEHDAEIKRQTIDEFITRIEEDLYTFVDNDSWTSDGSLMWKCDEVREIAEQMKGEL